MIEIPETVRNNALSAGGEQWLEDLPELIAELAATWGLTVGAPYDEGTEAYVARVDLEDDTPAVLKVPRKMTHSGLMAS